MKSLFIFVSIIATSSLFSSIITSETVKKEEKSDISIDKNNSMEKELSTSRIARISREVRENRVVRMGRNSRGIRENRVVRIARNAREIRKNRIVRMGKNSKGIRLARVVPLIDEVQEKNHPSIKLSAFIKKLPL